ncbi:hypothetical protein GCM10022219_25340 [Microbacterium oryzae]
MPMTPRRLLILVTTVTAVMTLTGCVPEPAPTPTPTGFASEEEAFAAAEETYRAYIDATNARNAGKKSDPTSYLMGEALDSDREVRQLLKETGRSFEGKFVITGFKPVEAQQIDAATSLSAVVCMDSSDVLVVDEDGNDVTPEGDIAVYALSVEFTAVDDELRISQSESSSETC